MLCQYTIFKLTLTNIFVGEIILEYLLFYMAPLDVSKIFAFKASEKVCFTINISIHLPIPRVTMHCHGCCAYWIAIIATVKWSRIISKCQYGRSRLILRVFFISTHLHHNRTLNKPCYQFSDNGVFRGARGSVNYPLVYRVTM